MLAFTNWIRITERLPMGTEQDNEVLVSVNNPAEGDDPYVTTAFFTPEKGFWKVPEKAFKREEINAWSHMPHVVRI